MSCGRLYLHVMWGSVHACHVGECACMSCGGVYMHVMWESVHACLVGCAHAPLVKS